MALMPCKECGASVSNTAFSCPQCGAPIQTARSSSTGKIVLWLLAILIGLPIVLFVGSAVIAGIMEGMSNQSARMAQSKPYTGRMRGDGAEFVLTDQVSTVGGECEGWHAVSLQKTDDPSSGLTDLMCWRRVGDNIEVTTKFGTGRRSDPASAFTD